MVNTTLNTQMQATTAAKLLVSASDFIRVGNREGAYEMSLEAIRLEPNNVNAWLMRFRTAVSSEERLLCLSQVVRLDPDLPLAKRNMYTALWVQFQKDPFLAYIEETDKAYFVRSKDYQFLAVPKDRVIPESYPPKRAQPLVRAYRWLGLAFMGLAVAGLGTLLFAPIAFWLAFNALVRPIERADRRRAWIVIILSSLLGAIGLLFGWLFLIHIIG